MKYINIRTLQAFACFVLISTVAIACGSEIRILPLQIPESGVSESDASKLLALSEALDVITASEDAESIFDAWRFGNGPRWRDSGDFCFDNGLNTLEAFSYSSKAFSSHQKKTNRLARTLFGTNDDHPLMNSFLELYVGKKISGETFFALVGQRGYVLLDVKEQVGSTQGEKPLCVVRNAEIVAYCDPLVQTWRFDDFGAPIQFEERRIDPAIEIFQAFFPDALYAPPASIFDAQKKHSERVGSTLERAVGWDSAGAATALAEPLDAPALVSSTPPVLSESLELSQGDAIFAAVEPIRRLLELIRKDSTPSRAALDQLNDGSHILFNVMSEDASRSYVGVSYQKLGSFVSFALVNVFGTATIAWPTDKPGVCVEWKIFGSREYAEFSFDPDGNLNQIRVLESPAACKSYALPRTPTLQESMEFLKNHSENDSYTSVVRLVDYNDDGSVKNDRRFLPGEKKIKFFLKAL